MISLLLLLASQLSVVEQLETKKFSRRSSHLVSIEKLGLCRLPGLIYTAKFGPPTSQHYASRLIINVFADTWIDKDFNHIPDEYDSFPHHNNNKEYIVAVYLFAKYIAGYNLYQLSDYASYQYHSEWEEDKYRVSYQKLFITLNWRYR